MPVDFPDPADDPDGTQTRDLITQVLEGAVADGTLVTGEGAVLREAGVLNADQFRVVARRFASVTDPDTDDAEDDKAARGEHLDVAKTFGGYHVEGFLTDEHGLLVSTAITAVMGAPAAEDTRTAGQRRAQGLADVARLVLDANQASPGAAIPPHLNVTVSWTELVTQITRTRDGLCLTCGQTTPGTRHPDRHDRRRSCRRRRGGRERPRTGGGGATGATGPGSRQSETQQAGFRQVRRRCPGCWPRVARCSPRPAVGHHGPCCAGLACDSAVTRIVFGPDGAVLDVGRAQRTVTGQMRRAVIARDEHCVFPGCDQPPSRCEVHHAIRHWADGGDTSVANSALLCWFHHQLVDARGIVMHWTGKPTTGASTVGALVETGWAFTDAHGHRIHLPQAIDALPPPDAEAA